MYKHDFIKTTYTCLKYVCLKCVTFSHKIIDEETCRFYSKAESRKYSHKWNKEHHCIKCGKSKNVLTHTFYKMGDWENSITKIEPCIYTNDEWNIKDVIE